MAKNPKSKSQFCQSFSWELPFEWFDRTGMLRMRNGLVAQVELDTFGTHGNYPGFRVKVINPTCGVVGEKYFLFDDYLDPKARADQRSDYKPPGYMYYVMDMYVASTECEWYIAVPKETRPFCKAIESFLLLFSHALA